MRGNLFRALLLALITVVSAIAYGVEVSEVELVCPIGGESFTARVVESEHRQGQMLDFKPYGDVIAPNPLAVCPANGLVMYEREFSVADLEKLESLIMSETYQSWRDEHTTYFLLAKTFEHMARDSLQVAFMYLQATWEVDTEPARYGEYVEHAKHAFQSYIDEANPLRREFVTAHLILSELYRRGAEFESATQVLDRIKGHDESSKPYASRLIILLYQLIKAKDDAPHAMP